MTERNGGSDSLRGSRASGMPRAPEITILDSAFWWEIDQAAHCCGRCEGFTPVDGCFKGFILGVIRLKCLSVGWLIGGCDGLATQTHHHVSLFFLANLCAYRLSKCHSNLTLNSHTRPLILPALRIEQSKTTFVNQ